MNYFRDRKISQAASDLIQFDADSIRQVVSADHRPDPDVWIVDPDAYEKNGRVLRDSDSPRMLAYSRTDQILYGTDGCNSCSRRVRTNLELLPPDELKQFAADNELRLELIERLVSLLRD
jgi:hypothetical protein